MMFAKVWTPEDPRVSKNLSNSLTKIESINIGKVWTPEDSRSSKTGGVGNKYETIEMPKAWTPEDPRAIKSGCLNTDRMEMAKTWSQDQSSRAETTKDASVSNIEKHMTLDCVVVQS